MREECAPARLARIPEEVGEVLDAGKRRGLAGGHRRREDLARDALEHAGAVHDSLHRAGVAIRELECHRAHGLRAHQRGIEDRGVVGPDGPVQRPGESFPGSALAARHREPRGLAALVVREPRREQDFPLLRDVHAPAGLASRRGIPPHALVGEARRRRGRSCVDESRAVAGNVDALHRGVEIERQGVERQPEIRKDGAVRVQRDQAHRPREAVDPVRGAVHTQVGDVGPGARDRDHALRRAIERDDAPSPSCVNAIVRGVHCKRRWARRTVEEPQDARSLGRPVEHQERGSPALARHIRTIGCRVHDHRARGGRAGERHRRDRARVQVRDARPHLVGPAVDDVELVGALVERHRASGIRKIEGRAIVGGVVDHDLAADAGRRAIDPVGALAHDEAAADLRGVEEANRLVVVSVDHGERIVRVEHRHVGAVEDRIECDDGWRCRRGDALHHRGAVDHCHAVLASLGEPCAMRDGMDGYGARHVGDGGHEGLRRGARRERTSGAGDEGAKDGGDHWQ